MKLFEPILPRSTRPVGYSVVAALGGADLYWLWDRISFNALFGIDWQAIGAFATFIAAAVAIGIGMVPVIELRRQNAAKAKALALVAGPQLQSAWVASAACVDAYRQQGDSLTLDQANVALHELWRQDLSWVKQCILDAHYFPGAVARAFAAVYADWDSVRSAIGRDNRPFVLVDDDPETMKALVRLSADACKTTYDVLKICYTFSETPLDEKALVDATGVAVQRIHVGRVVWNG